MVKFKGSNDGLARQLCITLFRSCWKAMHNMCQSLHNNRQSDSVGNPNNMVAFLSKLSHLMRMFYSGSKLLLAV